MNRRSFLRSTILLVLAAASLAQAQPSASTEALTVEVAEIPGAFVFFGPTAEDGMPVRGAAFVTRGYLYPAGTLRDEHGVQPDGSPTYPDAVIGIWTCRGWFIGDALAAGDGPAAITTQLFAFDEAFGGDVLVTEGYEVMSVGVPFRRAITGGTGRFEGVTGEVRQEMVSMNDEMLVHYTFLVPLAEPR